MPYEVIKSTQDDQVVGVDMGGEHKHKFFNNGFRLPDSESAKARDIRQKFGQDGTNEVIVARVPSHRTGKTFAITNVPWHDEETK